MDWIIWTYAIAALSSAVAAVLAWAAKLRWAKEYSAAKDETIKAKDAQIELLKTQIESLRELSPMKVREYFISVKEQLEEFIDDLQKQLQEARAEIEQKSDHIEKLGAEGQAHAAEIKRLTEEISTLQIMTQAIEGEGSKLLNTFARSHELAHYFYGEYLNDASSARIAREIESLRERIKEVTKDAPKVVEGKTGEVCQRSGLYACIAHALNTIPLAKGNRFPPCSLDGGHATTWVRAESDAD